MSPLKVGVLAAWIVAACGFVVATDSAAAGVARFVFWAMFAIHVIECAVFLPKLRNAPGGLGGHLVQTFVFGVAHIRELPEASSGTADA